MALVAFLFVTTSVEAQGTRDDVCDAVPVSVAGAFVSRGALGASIGVLDSATLAPAIGRSLSEALTARLSGVSVMHSSGIVGLGSRVRLRGPGGILTPQQPLLYIDGVRADGELQSAIYPANGQAPSRLDDIPVDAVRCIYVLRGPAATARYGTDAAAGVIHVITRAARPDSAPVRGFIEGAAAQDIGDYPANFGNAESCTRAAAALGRCTAGALRSWNPLEASSPFRTGRGFHAGADGHVAAARRATLGVGATMAVDDGPLRRNEHRQYGVTTAAMFRSDSAFEIHGDLWVLGGRAELPLTVSTLSIVENGLLGSSVDDPVRRGYRNGPLAKLEPFVTTQRVRRIGGVTHLRWSPASWLSFSALAGREDSRTRDEMVTEFFVNPSGTLEPFGLARGELRVQRSSLGASAVLMYGMSSARLTTELSFDHLAETNRMTSGSSSRGYDPKTKGVLVRQTVGWNNDARFVEVGLRRDVLDRSIIAIEKPTYPFVSASWDIGREKFFPRGRLFSSVRLRGAYGESGDSRGFGANLDLAFLSPLPPGTDQWPVERTRELEGGVDVGFFDDRVRVAATMFTKRTSDALRVTSITSSGFSFMGLTSTAAWRTHGVELGIRARLFDAARFRGDLVLDLTTIDNKVTSVGSAFPIVSNYYRIAPGYPLFGAWGRRFTITEANADGVIVPLEVVPDTTAQYLGSAVPTRELGLAPSLTFANVVTLGALVDYRGGFRVVNVGGRARCSFGVCEALYAPNASAAEQARAVDPSDAGASWIEDASFVKLREVSIAWAMPQAWSRFVGARSSSLVLAGRNLLTSTDYTGMDPEGSYTGQARTDQQEAFSVPLPRVISLRMALGW